MNVGYAEDYTSQLPIFIYLNPEVVQPVYPDLDRTIAKTSLVVDRHSMDIKGSEYCKWIDDTWIVMGEAQFLKGELTQAKQIFDFTKRKYQDPSIKQLSFYWSARVLTAQEQYSRAGDELRKISLAEGFPKNMLGELHAFRADYFLKQGKTEDAIKELELSIANTPKRQVKTRRMFILAQLYKLEGDGISSDRLYAEVIKRNPIYDMAFYAKINRALAYEASSGNSEEIRLTLGKMLKDEKNADFLDQIYYALAGIDLKEGNEAAGIENLKLATKKSVKNGNAKGLAFYKLGEIYFEKKDYPTAQAYYDSTITFLNPDHPDYQNILSLSTNLTQLMQDIIIIDREDSLQAFARLPKSEQENKIDARIEDLKQKELDAERQKQLNQIQAQAAAFDQGSQINKNIGKGEWYFYNAAAVGFGAAEFKKIWGQRKNEDNWRRSDKTSLQPELEDAEKETLASDTIPGADDPKNPNFYWKDVPDNDEKLARSDALIIEALYDLGIVYKEQMHDEKLAIDAFENLISRYDSSKYHANCYYQLYLMYGNAGNTQKADYYKAKVLEEYPETDYAKVIANPNYAAQSLADEKQVKQFYETAYAYFNQGAYRQAYESVTESLQTFPNSEFEPQFRLLEALCLGFMEGEASMINSLEKVARSFNGHEVAKEAQEILNYFKNGKTVASTNEAAEQEAAVEEIEKAKSNYRYDLGASHNFVVIVPDTSNINQLQSVVSNFNRKYFSTRGLKTSNISLNNGKTMIIVSNVGAAAKSIDYLGAFRNAGEDTETITKRGYSFFVISYDNYAFFYKDQGIDAYLAFFAENYVKTN